MEVSVHQPGRMFNQSYISLSLLFAIAAFIILSSLFSIVYSLYQTRTSAVQLHELVKLASTVTVRRDGRGEKCLRVRLQGLKLHHMRYK